MNSKKYNILIIEPSYIVAYGLSSLLEKSGESVAVGIINDMASYDNRKYVDADIIILNPSVLCELGTGVSTIPDSSGKPAIIAVYYGPYNERISKEYDICISIFDSPQTVSKKIKAALESSKNKRTEEKDRNELSEREKQILVAVAKGKTNKEIAYDFNISIFTVITHRKNISHKLGINSIAGLTVYAIMNKLIDPAEF
ncbi:MAG: LuxR C-terminal-related transcriptional regulator [Bacteroidales bacterium]|jgi:DNA-binding NarL/FixJ family response regulator|nr:LuxR C-terminal-related transcriptional regulator [Bacteroidales bacterium]MCI1784574.1 LuxR C-terminal-related transcriptional regulator [Bacteroidales bacterium]